MDPRAPDLSDNRVIKFVRAQSPDPDHSSSRKKIARAHSPEHDQSTLIANLAIDLVSESEPEHEESIGNNIGVGVGIEETAFQEFAPLEAAESETEDPFGHLGTNL